MDRYNDLRAFQMQLQTNFDESEGVYLNNFIHREKSRRTKQEALEFYEKRMGRVCEDFLITESRNTLKPGADDGGKRT